MAYWENSFIISLIVRFWSWVCARYSESLIGSWIGRLVAAFKRGAIWRFLTGDRLTEELWTGSFAYRALQWCLDLPVRILARLGRFAPDNVLPRFFLRLTAPALGVMMLALFVIPQERWNNLYSLVAVLAILALYLSASLSGTAHRLRLRTVGAWSVLLMLVAFLSWVWSDSRNLGTRFLFFAITCALLVLLLVSVADSERKLLWIIRLSAVGLAVCAVYALWQRHVGVDVNGIYTDLSLNPDMPGRVYSFFENPNSFANILVLFGPLMLGMAIYAKGWPERLAFLLVFLLCGLALVMTYSRGGWLAMVFAVFVLMLFVCPRWVPLIILVGLLALPLLPSNILDRLLTVFNFSDSSTYTRSYTYSGMLHLIGRYPIFGVGLGADSVRYSIYCMHAYTAKALFVHGHNIYLQIWAESGVFALLAFLGSMFGALRAGRRAWLKASNQPRLRGVVLGCISGLSGSLLFGLTDFAWSYPRVMVMFWFVFALLLAGTRLINAKEGTEND